MAEWISVKDRMPDKRGEGAMHLVYDKGWEGQYVAEYNPQSYYEPDGSLRDWGFCPLTYPEITHWMPLPDPPEEVPND